MVRSSRRPTSLWADQGDLCRDGQGSMEVPSGKPWSLRILEVYTVPSPTELNGYEEDFLLIQYEI